MASMQSLPKVSEVARPIDAPSRSGRAEDLASGIRADGNYYRLRSATPTAMISVDTTSAVAAGTAGLLWYMVILP